MTEHGLQANFRALCVWLFHESNRLIPKKNREIKISMSIIVFSTYNALKLEKSAISNACMRVYVAIGTQSKIKSHYFEFSLG